MRHRKRVKKLGRSKSHREAMVANLASSLVLNEFIVTTEPKAKVCKALVDKVVSIGKKKSLNTKRRVEQILRDKLASAKVVDVLADKYKDRTSGFVTMVRVGNRRGDNAKMSKLVLVGSEPFRKVKKLTAKKKARIKKKKQPEVEEKKKSVLDRMKQLRGRFARRGKKEDVKGTGRFEKGPSEGGVKSRSGI